MANELMFTGHLAGLSLEEIVKAVYMLEQSILSWQRMKMREGEETGQAAV